jgi:hypothetical protein
MEKIIIKIKNESELKEICSNIIKQFKNEPTKPKDMKLFFNSGEYPEFKNKAYVYFKEDFTYFEFGFYSRGKNELAIFTIEDSYIEFSGRKKMFIKKYFKNII